MDARQHDSSFRRIDLVPVRVQLILDRLRVEGTIYVEPRIRRFSDAWDALLRERRGFIAVTDARLGTHDGGSVMDMVTFLVVDKAEIRAAIPLVESQAERQVS
jgi:hypothetical protein